MVLQSRRKKTGKARESERKESSLMAENRLQKKKGKRTKSLPGVDRRKKSSSDSAAHKGQDMHDVKLNGQQSS